MNPHDECIKQQLQETLSISLALSSLTKVFMSMNPISAIDFHEVASPVMGYF